MDMGTYVSNKKFFRLYRPEEVSYFGLFTVSLTLSSKNLLILEQLCSQLTLEKFVINSPDWTQIQLNIFLNHTLRKTFKTKYILINLKKEGNLLGEYLNVLSQQENIQTLQVEETESRFREVRRFLLNYNNFRLNKAILLHNIVKSSLFSNFGSYLTELHFYERNINRDILVSSFVCLLNKKSSIQLRKLELAHFSYLYSPSLVYLLCKFISYAGQVSLSIDINFQSKSHSLLFYPVVFFETKKITQNSIFRFNYDKNQLSLMTNRSRSIEKLTK
eukprot:snap_masked-scaffold_94-processed-gene-0.13-mRNA-1 protein AED:1.00 eAED:1.00 QI:0/0/0/0/1/1/2/0/274